MTDIAAIRSRIKRLIVTSLNLDGMAPDSIGDVTPLFGEGLGLDSVDALELVVALEKEFGIKIKSDEVGREAFASVSALAEYVSGRLTADLGAGAAPGGGAAMPGAGAATGGGAAPNG